MREIYITLRVVTPLILAGANQSHAEFRLPSLKGALRWWYRAAYGARSCGEKKLFGATSTGQGLFLMRASPLVADRTSTSKLSGMDYLLGPGFRTKDDARPYISPGVRIGLELVFRNDATQNDVDRVMIALYLLTHLGGLGSRSRRGFGSLLVENLEGYDGRVDFSLPQEARHLARKLRAGLAGLVTEGEGSSTLPEYTRFSGLTQIRVLRPPTRVTDWSACLQWFSDVFGRFRVNAGNNENFPADRDLVKEFAMTGRLPRAPERSAFGLPHNYYFKDLPKNGRDVSTDCRRASPLLVHVHALADSRCVPVVSFFPAKLLPEDTNINFSGPRGCASVAPPDGFRAVERFLAHLKQWSHDVEINGGGDSDA